MKNLKIYIFLFLSILLADGGFAGGGWPQPKKKGFFKLNQSILRSGQFFDGEGNITDITTISLYTTSIYGEYGITDRLTGIIYAPFFVRSTLNQIRQRQSGDITPGDQVNSVGDVDIGIKYGLTVDKKIALSASLTFGLALGETQGGETGILQTGDGENNQLVMLEASRSFYPKSWYATAAVGFNNRTKGFSDEFRYGLEIGFTGIKNLTAALKINSVVSLFNGDDSQVTGNSIFANNTEYFSITPEINYDIKQKLGVSFSAGLAASGKRILAAPNLGVGVYVKL